MAIKSYQIHSPTVGQGVYVDEQALVLGDVVLGDHVSVWPMAVIRGDMHYIRIGHSTNIQDAAVLHITHPSALTSPAGAPLNIGNRVTVGHGAILHGCTVGDLCLIGMRAVVLDGAVLEEEVMLGAGSLVPPGKILQSGYLYVGSPVVQKRPLSERERAFLRYSAENYVRLKEGYL